MYYRKYYDWLLYSFNQIKIKTCIKINNVYVFINSFMQYTSIDVYRFENTGSNEFLRYFLIFFFFILYPKHALCVCSSIKSSS